MHNFMGWKIHVVSVAGTAVPIVSMIATLVVGLLTLSR